jgi:hypothetical protein
LGSNRIDLGTAPAPASPKAARMSQGTKLLIAVVLLIAAGAALAWNFGLFSGLKEAAPVQQVPAHSGGRGMAPNAGK